MSRSVSTPTSRPVGIASRTRNRRSRCAGSPPGSPRATARRHGHRLSPADHAHGADTRPGTRAAVARLGEFGHGPVYAWTRGSGGRPDRRRRARGDLRYPRGRGSDPRRRRHARRLSAIAFGSGGLFAKPVYAAGVDWLTLMAWRFAVGGGHGVGRAGVQPRRRDARCDGSPRRTLLGAIGLGVFYVTNTAPTTRGSRPCRSGWPR